MKEILARIKTLATVVAQIPTMGLIMTTRVKKTIHIHGVCHQDIKRRMIHLGTLPLPTCRYLGVMILSL